MTGRVYLRLGRVSNLPTVWTNVLAGIVLAGGDFEAPVLASLLLGLPLFYVGGMFLNDAFDRRWDARARPDRPIPSGAVGAVEVFALGFGMLALAVLVLAAGVVLRRAGPAPWPVLSGLLLAGSIVAYDAWHKSNPASPIVMGLCRALVYVTAALMSADALPRAVVAGALVLLAYLVGLSYVARQENLAQVRSLWPLVLLAAPFVYGAPIVARSAPGALAYAGLLALVAGAVWLLRARRGLVPRAVGLLLAGICLLDALLVAGQGSTALAGLAALGFPVTVILQRHVSGT